ncbi:immunity 26/phosphotriesterase HocA family protein [Yersinia pseudotuberculosis]|uniref:Putative cytoplasmic protein n=1 Tax=Yersinia pseudotuberculosis serotype O:3 (strain YPIII) TaxID=502800 RepID=A0A0H3AXA4_YERPY|nr:immunity 26/phosphotriesterase HocA family protein [Yersinia pseudotuberculosis]AJJ06843.1 immunity 14 family protein [Yersinia pseudotuberculosis]AJJ57651.1 immunity 14 family protein [Yersinia pseudotuberculosis YPIII]AXY36139.1 phosphotriesterase [Yersinia pseudotuberculosis]AYW89688.1 phosphotriesterase [Yersinia pseudotuberculosis]AYX02413.1 phosphotriesterase [Yersinia pseudotuberculosis]
MSDFKFWRWDKKPRTMLRFIKPGDIFCFRLDGEKYCFGRIISEMSVGHVAEIFDFISSLPEVTEGDISHSLRLTELIVLDTYTLFDKKIEPEGDWRIIGHQDSYTPTNVENTYFTYGIGNSCKKVDIFNNEVPITESEARKIPELVPLRDVHIKELIKSYIG